MILYSEGATQAQEDEAEMILGVLCEIYPGHPWAVRVYDGGFFIQYLDRPFSQPYGMNCKYKDFAHDAAVLKREIIMKAGEWLERAGLARGRYNGDEIQYVEGVPDKYQRSKLPESIEVTVAQTDDAEGTRIRDATPPGMGTRRASGLLE